MHLYYETPPQWRKYVGHFCDAVIEIYINDFITKEREKNPYVANYFVIYVHSKRVYCIGYNCNIPINALID